MESLTLGTGVQSSNKTLKDAQLMIELLRKFFDVKNSIKKVKKLGLNVAN